MPNSQSPTSTSASYPSPPPNQKNKQQRGVSAEGVYQTPQPNGSASTTDQRKKPRVIPHQFPPSGEVNSRSAISAPQNHDSKPYDSVVPPSAGSRIPVSIQPIDSKANGTTRKSQHNVDGEMGRLMAAATASMPDNMRTEAKSQESPSQAQTKPEDMRGASPSAAFASQDVTVEQFVRAQRPRSLRMQLRFIRTVVFALWLFGRLILWQVYIAQWFPNWVSKRNTQRWQKYARQFRNFAVDMGGVMIKAGQFASTRADILPEEVIAELADLQDKVPTVPYKRIETVLKRELGDLERRFAWIDREPIAAASMGQVHRARVITPEGEDAVVVKVQRPNIRNLVYTDMAALFIVARIAMRFSFVRRRADAIQLSEEFGRVLLEEVSYEKEAQNAQRFQRMFAEDMGVYVPTVYPEHSTDQVITLEDVTSLKIDDYEALAAAGINRKEVARRLMDTYMQQIFEDRFFHADPHPGNLFVYPLPVEDEQRYIQQGGGRPFYLIFIDFGMTGALTREIVQGLINTLTAVVTRDAKKLVQSYVDLGFLLPDADLRRIEEATNTVFDTVWGMSVTDMTNMDFEVVANIGAEFNDLLYDMPFRVPQDFVYLGRTVGILTGMATALDPGYNPWDEISGYMQRLITTNSDGNIFDELGKILQDSLEEIISQGPQGLINVVMRVARQFQRVNRTEQMLQQIINGEVQIETKLSIQHRRQLERIELQGKRTSRTFMAGSLIIVATLLHINGDSSLALVSLFVGGGLYVSSWLMRV
jgi:predicted unusual protein kinase regulating ubiquinone biosynthesis (AarF/ABC1/UbiB family)